MNSSRIRIGLAASAVLLFPAAWAESAPFVTTPDRISSGDTAWMLMSTALVLLMTLPGLALFYAGMVRKKNILSTVLQSFAICCLVTALWVAVGYSLAFTPGSPWLGGFSQSFLNQLVMDRVQGTVSVSHIAPTIPESVFVMFQLTFAIITPALVTGAFAERMRFGGMMLFMALWSLLVYAPVAHWVWEPGGWLASMGALDFAGGTVVHINAGAAGLVCALYLGKRHNYGREPFFPNHLGLTFIGASLLWVGWFGFNAGSALEANGIAGLAFINTWVATAAAAVSWSFAEWIFKGKPSMLGGASGAVAGLVAITPACGFVGVNGALAIGLLAGVICLWGVHGLKKLLGADDALDVFGVHGIGGILGALLTGVFAAPSLGGTGVWDYVANGVAPGYDILAQVKIQAIGVITTVIWSGVVAFIAYKLVDITIGMRVDEENERIGLDVTSHGERAYND